MAVSPWTAYLLFSATMWANADLPSPALFVGIAADSQPVLEDGHRCGRPDRSCHSLGEQGKQGPVRSGHPDERGAEDRVRRVFQNRLFARQHLGDRE